MTDRAPPHSLVGSPDQSGSRGGEVARWRALLDDQHELICRYLPVGDLPLTYANRAYAAAYATTPEQLLDTSLIDLFPESMHQWARERVAALCRGDAETVHENDVHLPDGQVRRFQWSDQVVTTGDGTTVEIQSIGSDVTEQRRTEAALRASERRLRWMFDHAPIGMALLSVEGRVDLANEALASFLGTYSSSLIGAGLGDLLAEDPDGDLMRPANGSKAASEQFERRFRRADGADAWGLLSIASPEGATDSPALLQVVDLTDRKRAEAELAYRAQHDPLTGLPNRARLDEEILEALRWGRRRGRDVALMFCDLDHFKVVNDSLGHDAGDALLVAVGRRLAGALDPGEVLGRFGGDEFVVVARGIRSQDDALARAGALAGVLANPIAVAGTEVPLGASVGVAVAPQGVGTPGALLRDADTAMYVAKGRGRGTVAACDDSMRTEAGERLALQTAMRGAAERNELELRYQPIVTARGEVHGCEALLRWRHPTRGLLSPDAFLRVAEESGAIHEIGEWVRREATRQLARWDAEGGLPPDMGMWINVSGAELMDPSLAAAVSGAARHAGVDPSRLTLEISERALLGEITGTLGALAETGVALAVDDVGTGHAALADLASAPLDVLKIDRKFIALLEPPGHQASVTAVLFDLARSLGLGLVAEGVETLAQDTALDQLDCDLRQGYLYARPMPPASLRSAMMARPSRAVRTGTRAVP